MELERSISWNFRKGITHKSGWLTKAGEYFISAPRKRYFVLDLRTYKLNYFEAMDCVNLIGTIDMKNATRAECTTELSFEVALPHRTYTLTADTKEELAEWLYTLQNLISVNLDVHETEAIYPTGYILYQRIAIAINDFLLEISQVTTQDFIRWVNHGVSVFLNIENSMYMKSMTPTKNDAVALMWLIYAKIAAYGELFQSGLIRIDDPDNKLFNFFLAVPDCYSRVSTHFPERFEEFNVNGGQFGFDIPAVEPQLNPNIATYVLPAKKFAVLFFKLNDGSLCIKLEAHGCPPVWKTKHMNTTDISTYMGHISDFVYTRVAHAGMLHRKEHVTEEYKEWFRDILLHCHERIDEKSFEDDYRHGCVFGISAMIHIIQHLIDGPSRKINQISESIAIFQSAVVVPESKHYSGILSGETLVKYEKLIALTLTDFSRGYKGDRKGHEVCLPYPSNWDELKEYLSLPMGFTLV